MSDIVPNVEITRIVDATPAELWPILSDVLRWPEWLPTVTAVTTDPAGGRPGTTRVGAAYRVTQPRLGTASWEITDWRPDAGFTWVSRRPGVTTTGTHELRPVDGGTEVRLGIAWVGPLAGLTRALLGGMTRDYVTREAAALAATVADR